MPKTKQQKQTTVDSLMAGIKNAKGVVFANFQGITVAQADELRRNSEKQGVQVLVAKKTLVRRALAENNISGTDPKTFPGGIVTLMSPNDEISAAKLVSDFAKKNEVMTIFGGLLEGKFIEAAMVKSLASLPGKQELLGKMVGSLQAPLSGLVHVLSGNLRSLVLVLNAYKDKQAAA